MDRPSRRVRNYTPLHKSWDRLQALLTRSGWPARLAQRFAGPAGVSVEEHEVALSGHFSRPLRIGFASDFHAGPTTHAEVLSEACAALTRSQPDVLLLGGDFVCLDARHIDILAEKLAAIPSPLGRFAVLGNHDLWVDYGYIERRLESVGIEVLCNRNVALPSPFEHVWICGLDDHWTGRPDGHAAMRGADGVRVVLMHQPSGLLDLAGERFDIAFCGHTHGGQIALPGGFPLILPHGKLSRRYSQGVHRLANNRTLLVSRGVGCSTIPFRSFSSPEVLLCTLRACPDPS